MIKFFQKSKIPFVKGILFLVLAELCFSSATVFAKFVTTGTNIPAIEITFLRFFFGFIITSFTIYRLKLTLHPNNKKFVYLRAILNTAAVIFFFLAVKYTTITNANMLNITYPVFIFLFAPFLINEKIKLYHGVCLAFTILGVFLIIHPDFHNTNIGDFYGLISGIVGALAIITLRKAREFDSTTTILFYLMGIGTIINGLLLIPFFEMPNGIQLLQMIASALLGFGGQIFLTSGYKHVEAGEGSMVSTSRILFAFILGSFFFSEQITFVLLLGAFLIVGSLTFISLRQLKK